jgi:hypothetical protein
MLVGLKFTAGSASQLVTNGEIPLNSIMEPPVSCSPVSTTGDVTLELSTATTGPSKLL